MELFGFEIKRKADEENTIKSFTAPVDDEGSVVVQATGGAYGTFVDLEGSAKNEAELVTKYRKMMEHGDVQRAVEDIVNEAIVVNYTDEIVDVICEDLEHSDSVKKRIADEFNETLKLLNFSNIGYDVFQKWYVDGRLYYHVIIDEQKPRDGIKELRYIDPRKIRKIREVTKQRDGNKESLVTVVKNEYFIYNETGFNSKAHNQTSYQSSLKGLKIAKDSVVHVTSGIMNENNSLVLSHLHKAIKPLNQLSYMEDAAVVYRVSRAPERRIFYIDVGNLPKMKAEQYLRDMMATHKNKLVYDASTGDIKDDRKFMTMLEDFWLPRREGGRGTEITTLPGGANLGEMEEVDYFKKKLYNSLNVPISRLESESGFQLGRASEISRDEIKFSRFIKRLRNRFSILFDKILEKQLILKGVITPEEWPDIQAALKFDFQEDNHFEELKQLEVMQSRIEALNNIDAYVGRYYSAQYVKTNVLMQSEEEVKQIEKEIKQEGSDQEDDEQGAGPPQQAQPQQQPNQPIQDDFEPFESGNTISEEEKRLIESASKYLESAMNDEQE